MLQATAGGAAATTFYVDDDGPGNYTTIQAAVNDAVSGDTIIVNPGTYPDERIQLDKSVTIKGASGYPSVGGFDVLQQARIEGLTITKGVDFDQAGTSCIIRNNKFYGSGISIGISYMYGNQTIMNNLFTESPTGIITFDSIYNKITGNTFQDCGTGIAFTYGGGGHVVTGNTFKNCDIGIRVTDDSVTIYNNYFSNDINLKLEYDGSVLLNTTKTTGENIIGGSYIGGNYWATPYEDGFSQTHLDTNGDGIAEEPYYMNEENIDYLPLVTPRTEPTLMPPVANFNMNITTGSAPLSVQFTDASQNAVSWSWDFDNNGVSDSDLQNPVYVYTIPGRYTVNLIARNQAGTASSKTAEINVTETAAPTPTPTPEPTPEDSGSPGDSQHSSGGSSGGGGTGGSPEPAKNVEVKELSQVFITNGKAVKFDFKKNATCVVYVGFDAIKNAGKTTTIVEELKNKSALVSELPAGEVYKSFNVWVGNAGYATSNNIENPVLSFKVDKSWIQDKHVDQDSIILNRYEDKAWVQLPVSLIGEDDRYLYFTAETPGFASFVITGKATLQTQVENVQILAENRSVGVVQSGDNGTEDVEFDGNSIKSKALLSFWILAGVLMVCEFLLKRMKK